MNGTNHLGLCLIARLASGEEGGHPRRSRGGQGRLRLQEEGEEEEVMADRPGVPALVRTNVHCNHHSELSHRY